MNRQINSNAIIWIESRRLEYNWSNTRDQLYYLVNELNESIIDDLDWNWKFI